MQKLDLTEGKVTPTIFRYCIPIILGSLLQVMFNMADKIVLGQMAGGDAVASVGACSTICLMIVNFFVGLGGGVTVILARAIGARDHDRSRLIIGTAVLASAALGIFAMLIALPLARPLLELTKCPPECFDGAITYITIYYCSVPAIIVYNFGASILRVSGDSRRPTVYLIWAGLLNVVLNVLLCFLLRQKVAAVAFATMASQTLGAVLVVRRLTRLEEDVRLDFRTIRFDRRVFFQILRYGIPSGFTSSLYCIANLQIQSGINSFGSAAIAGNSAGGDIEGLLAAFTSGFSHGTLAMTGQSIGADKRNRVRSSFWYTMLWSTAVTSVLAAVVMIFRVPLVRLFVPDMPEALPFAMSRMYHVTALYTINAVNAIFSAFLNAFGYTLFTMISSLLSTILFRTIWMQLIYPRNPTFDNIMLCFTIAWLISLAALGTMTAIVYVRYNRGKMKKTL